MLTIDDIIAMVDEVVDIMRHNERTNDENKIAYRPTYWKEYNMAEAQEVHALGKYPDHLFDRKVPNETEQQKEYRRLSFESTTMPIWNKAVQAVQGRVWNAANYSIQWPDEDQRDYFTVDYPDHGSLVQWFQKIRLPKKLYDANAVQVIMPKMLPLREDEDGNLINDDTQLIEPECIIYHSEDVLHRDRQHIMLLTDERSVVMYNGKPKQSGLVFLIIDDTNYWKAVQVGKQIDYQFVVDVYYEHNLGYIPAQLLGGVPKEKHGTAYYQSYFWPAVGDLNTALYDESTLSLAKIANIYPERWEVVEECYVCQGNGYTYDDEGEQTDCDLCSGSGYRQRPHPLNALTVKLPDRLDDRPTPPMPPAGYLEKDMESPKFLRDEILRKKEDAFAHINLDVSTRPNGQTATEKKIDREELFSFLLTISSEEFKALDFTIDTIGRLRHGEQWNDDIIIDPPKDFTIRSYKELTEEIAEARKSNLPLAAQRKLLNEYNSTRFNNDNLMAAETALIYAADRLAGLTNEETIKQYLAGAVSLAEVVLHTSIDSFIEQITEQDDLFYEKERQAQVEILRQKADEVAATLRTNTADADILTQLGVAGNA